jgi:hypothetical protein
MAPVISIMPTFSPKSKSLRADPNMKSNAIANMAAQTTDVVTMKKNKYGCLRENIMKSAAFAARILCNRRVSLSRRQLFIV